MVKVYSVRNRTAGRFLHSVLGCLPRYVQNYESENSCVCYLLRLPLLHRTRDDTLASESEHNTLVHTEPASLFVPQFRPEYSSSPPATGL